MALTQVGFWVATHSNNEKYTPTHIHTYAHGQVSVAMTLVGLLVIKYSNNNSYTCTHLHTYTHGQVSVALTLVGFWVVNYRTDNEFLQAYMFCGRNEVLFQPPYMVARGVYFDGTPCIDINSVMCVRICAFVRVYFCVCVFFLAFVCVCAV